MRQRLALIGVGGKMGMRIAGSVAKHPDYAVSRCETGQAGQERPRERGLAASPAREAVPQADVVVLAASPPGRIP
jgi:3-hydroxyisobutyrate dehydrogenase-like beta-hydroxyacid dehydrogenase